MSMRVLLTGGSGFIGRNIVESLQGKYEILAPRHSELDLADETSVKTWFLSHPLDAVIHSATKPGHRNAGDPTAIAITNLHMFSNLFENARLTNVKRFLFLGSGSEYDMRNYRPKMSEDSLGDFFEKIPVNQWSRLLIHYPQYISACYSPGELTQTSSRQQDSLPSSRSKSQMQFYLKSIYCPSAVS